MADSKEILPHTADIRIRITSGSLPELFQLSLKSLNQLLSANFDKKHQPPELKEDLELQSPDTTALLIDFLSEVLTLSQIYKAIYFAFDIVSMTDCTLKGVLRGVKVEEFKEDIKAVTYHEADVKVNEDGDWETVIIFDI